METNETIEALSRLLNETVGELQKLKEQDVAYVWNSDKKAYEELGIGRTYFEKIRHKLPHIEIPDEKTGSVGIVYPKKAVKQWLDEHTTTY
ncbi:hypothetical protein [Leuconostoc fallax]|uniref:Uncharacterized protein n=1 Tax=Leuconostoc fallax TaxID=1251 RepID=A0A4R5N834_9LACO|nr:hypothetical protein [Leuconostoc fallax]MBU7455714.1 hypothetical protein [Leuconostoc fallax]TDG68045.1 hypothetical protein C5L23_000351 [Leuconostoc fallax]